MGKKTYIVSGGGLVRAGRHKWFGPIYFGDYKGWANFITTRSLRHANAQYRRVKIAERQIDVRHDGKARVLKWGKTK